MSNIAVVWKRDAKKEQHTIFQQKAKDSTARVTKKRTWWMSNTTYALTKAVSPGQIITFLAKPEAHTASSIRPKI
jgi:hypothetical protein